MARSSSPRHVSIGFEPGARVPAHVVTPGCVMLATWGDEALDRWVVAHDFAVFAPAGSTDRARFRDQVLAARALGRWITERQLDPSLCGLALALKDRKGDCRGAHGMTVPMAANTREQLLSRMPPLLQEAAQVLRPIL